jgi:hypothetical protein
MIKDCTEDRLLILRSIQKVSRPDASSSIDKSGMGYPTVDEIMKLSDVYYGPPKVRVLWHGSI